jgi:hypothetical protein
MNQEKGAGHHAVTKLAVSEFYAALGHGGTVDGLSETRFFNALDRAQAHQDRWWGPTTHPAWLDGYAQREHAMADPHLTGPANLQIDRDYILAQLELAHAAHVAGDAKGEMEHLGAAVHALEDSYSDAHMFRDESVYAGNRYAPIQSINVFDPGGLYTHGPVLGEGTHDERFDNVMVDKHGNPVYANHRAGSAAVADMLHVYFRDRDADAETSATDLLTMVDRFFQAAPGGVRVNDRVTDAWEHARDHRLEITEEMAAEHQLHATVPDPNVGAAPRDTGIVIEHGGGLPPDPGGSDKDVFEAEEEDPRLLDPYAANGPNQALPDHLGQAVPEYSGQLAPDHVAPAAGDPAGVLTPGPGAQPSPDHPGLLVSDAGQMVPDAGLPVPDHPGPLDVGQTVPDPSQAAPDHLGTLDAGQMVPDAGLPVPDHPGPLDVGQTVPDPSQAAPDHPGQMVPDAGPVGLDAAQLPLDPGQAPPDAPDAAQLLTDTGQPLPDTVQPPDAGQMAPILDGGPDHTGQVMPDPTGLTSTPNPGGQATLEPGLEPGGQATLEPGGQATLEPGAQGTPDHNLDLGLTPGAASDSSHELALPLHPGAVEPPSEPDQHSTALNEGHQGGAEGGAIQGESSVPVQGDDGAGGEAPPPSS